MTVEAFSKLAKILPEPAILVTHNGEILSANPSFLRIISVGLEDIKDKNLTEISITPEEKLLEFLRNCSRSRQLLIGSILLRGAGGETIKYRCEGAVLEPAAEDRAAKIFLRLKPKESADSKFILLTQKINELNREIFDRKRAEEESRKLYQEAKEANRLKDEFLATISHELRTPLNSILGWTQILKMNEPDGDHFAKALETIEKSARSQTQLVEDILDVSRIISGKLRLNLRSVEIASVIGPSVESLRPAAENKGVRLLVRIDPTSGLISGDAGRLQQAIRNLLSNAIKFTPKNGSIEIRVERTDPDMEIAVSDTGDGIEADFLPYVFDRFRQADGSKSRKHGGLGLGLAITRDLIELHGGTIQAFSEGSGKGATFIIKLPVMSTGKIYDDEMAKRTHPVIYEDSETRPVLENLRLLVVDDEADARELMDFLLTSCGARVALAVSAADALEKLQNTDFDVLISDVGMPSEDGCSLIKKIRASDGSGYAKIKAIALTGHAGTEYRRQVLSAGFDTHIAKPFEHSELISAIVGLTGPAKENYPNYN